MKSAVAGLIKFHEDRIEELIAEIETYDGEVLDIDDGDYIWGLFDKIDIEYESIMAIEHWLEDVI